MNSKSRRATIISVALWTLSLLLAFMIPAASAFIWLPDALLLIGFLPLLLLWRAHWFTLLFGLFNTFIGFFLLVLENLMLDPAVLAKFTPQMKVGGTHLVTMHSAWTWMVLGVLASVWGLCGCLHWLYKFIAGRAKSKSK
jgi:hypothetical protein